MVKVELSKIIIDEKRHDQVIVLKELDGERFLPIVIGLAEATAIRMRISGFQPPRPLTHDLIVSILKNLNAGLEYIVIDALEFNTYHAKLHLKTQDGLELDIDSRPSDAIAVALRMDAPMFIKEEVFNSADLFDV